MQVGMIGLGRMGLNMAKRLLQGGHRVIAYNRTREKTDLLVKDGAVGVYSLTELVENLSPPRVVWIMLPAGSAVDDHINQLKELLSPNDIVVDGGNTYYKDDIHRAQTLGQKNIRFMDGLSTLIHQARRSFLLWTRIDVEPEEFRRALEDEL